LGQGSADQVLTSDGTDISWEDAAGGTTLSGSTNNTVTTVTGANAIQGEANMTFDGTDLTIPDKIIHGGDTDTYVQFDTNTINFNSGGQNTLSQLNGVNFMNAASPTAPSGSSERSYIYHHNTGNTFLKMGAQYANDAAAVYIETRVTPRIVVLGSGNIVMGGTAVIDTNANVSIYENLNYPLALSVTSTANTAQINFFNGNGQIGSVSTNGSATAFNTSSDYRLKDVKGSIKNGLERTLALNPIEFAWKVDGSISEGFIAHETQEAGWTDGVSGEKDDEKMQEMDYGRITPLLVKAIQEQQELILDLQQRITELESS